MQPSEPITRIVRQKTQSASDLGRDQSGAAGGFGSISRRFHPSLESGDRHRVCSPFSLFVRPPHRSLGPFLNTLACLFLLLGATAFLPANWFSLPAWRVALTNDFGIPLGGMVSPQPWMSLDSFILLIAGATWVYYLSSFEASLREVRLAIRLFAVEHGRARAFLSGSALATNRAAFLAQRSWVWPIPKSQPNRRLVWHLHHCGARLPARRLPARPQALDLLGAVSRRS